jgi:hypothetical protein
MVHTKSALRIVVQLTIQGLTILNAVLTCVDDHLFDRTMRLWDDLKRPCMNWFTPDASILVMRVLEDKNLEDEKECDPRAQLPSRE